ncbi:MAG: hypothetical protein HZC28_18050 [Spirochaetes bacterium]|nr:hypothetical protein [Spirochaetota bacterium]
MENTLQTNEKALARDLDQTGMQAALADIAVQRGIAAALDALYDWSFAVGYITREKLEDNKRYRYFDESTGVTFRTQINYARSNYSPKPLTGVNIPKLHCPICYENVGIPGKEDLRVFRFDLAPSRTFFAQLTPFPLFPYHYVLIDMQKRPMIMERQSVQDLVDFITMSPGYTGCSNSDVEWAGASVLVHHHYQVFKGLSLPIMEASIIPEYSGRAKKSGHAVSYGLLNYPIATCRVSSADAAAFTDACGDVIAAWKKQLPGKNTCNLTVVRENGMWTAHIIFRNPDHRTPGHLTKIKSEGVGIIEVAGEGIYPVPKGPEEKELWRMIDEEGLSVIKGVIEGNNPVARSDFKKLNSLIGDAVYGS